MIKSLVIAGPHDKQPSDRIITEETSLKGFVSDKVLSSSWSPNKQPSHRIVIEKTNLKGFLTDKVFSRSWSPQQTTFT